MPAFVPEWTVEGGAEELFASYRRQSSHWRCARARVSCGSAGSRSFSARGDSTQTSAPPLPPTPAGQGELGGPPAADPTLTNEDDHREIDHNVLRGSAWTAAGYGTRQLLAFSSVLVLARLIDPKAFGLIALATPFFLALQYLQESGLSAALVHRRTDVERAAATLVVATPMIGCFFYVVMFFAAPPIAHAFHAPELTLVLRIVGIMAVLRSLGIAPGALLERTMNFRARAQVDIAAATTQVAVAIPLAVLGAGCGRS